MHRLDELAIVEIWQIQEYFLKDATSYAVIHHIPVEGTICTPFIRVNWILILLIYELFHQYVTITELLTRSIKMFQLLLIFTTLPFYSTAILSRMFNHWKHEFKWKSLMSGSLSNGGI